MSESKTKINWIYVVLLLLLLLVTVFIVILSPRGSSPAEEESPVITVAAEGESAYRILIDPEDRQGQAAAEYLANAIRNRTDAELPITGDRRGGPFIRILSGQRPSGGDDAPYVIALDKDGIRITVRDGEKEFAAVRAIADCWVSADCGITDGSDLYIDLPMIRDRLSDLPLEIDGQLKILTQNMRNADDPDGNSVSEREERFFELVEEYQPDLIGTQEVTDSWMSFFEERLAGTYAIYGYSRDGRDTREGERNAILLRRTRFDYLDGDTFWLSETPYIPASRLDYNGSSRICTWAFLRDRQTGKLFLFSNTHLQNGSVSTYGEIRTQQLQTLFDQLQKGNDYMDYYPGFLTGDFNGSSTEEFYTLATSVYRNAQSSALIDSSQVDYTFHNYGDRHSVLDYCFHSGGNTTILDYQILDKQYGGYVSDHYGVLITAIVN